MKNLMHFFLLFIELRPIILLTIVYGDVNIHIRIEHNPFGHKNANIFANRKKKFINSFHYSNSKINDLENALSGYNLRKEQGDDVSCLSQAVRIFY